MATSINPAVLQSWLQDQAEVPTNRAGAAAAALAATWNAGDLDYQTARDILGEHLSDSDPRPQQIADDLATHVGLTLAG